MVALNKEFKLFKIKFNDALKRISSEATAPGIAIAIENETIHLIEYFNLTTDDVNKLDTYIGFYLRVIEYIAILNENRLRILNTYGYDSFYEDFVNEIIETIRKATMLVHLVSDRFDSIINNKYPFSYRTQLLEHQDNKEYLIQQYIGDITHEEKIKEFAKITFADWLGKRVRSNTLAPSPPPPPPPSSNSSRSSSNRSRSSSNRSRSSSNSSRSSSNRSRSSSNRSIGGSNRRTKKQYKK